VPRVLKRRAAKRDLTAQWVWYAENASVEIAERFIAAAEQAIDLLCVQPESGIPVIVRKAELRGVRRFPLSGGFEKHVLFYFPLKDGIDLIRVVHGSRNLNRLLADSSCR
jgi:toxin ParE1/3/4